MSAPAAREFCKHCGAGIGKFRRYGEGTCPECDQQWAEHQVRVSPEDEAAINSALSPESAASNALAEEFAKRMDGASGPFTAWCRANKGAILAALKPGNAVPREPTEAMLAAANAMPYLRASSLQMVWRTMHDAATKAGEKVE